MGRMVCHSELRDGSQCDGLATVSAARFVYKHDETDWRDDGGLREIVYAINCPKCGQRMLMDRIDSNKHPSAAIQAARDALANRVPVTGHVPLDGAPIDHAAQVSSS
jgi:hypothetical protein